MIRQLTGIVAMILTDEININVRDNAKQTLNENIKFNRWACGLLIVSNISFFMGHWLFCSKYWVVAHKVG
jgi:hypothetical protein